MRYELFLRRVAPLSDEIQSTLRDVVIEAGEGTLTLDLYRREGSDGVTGFDLGVDPNLPRGCGLLCDLTFRLAREHELTVYDPQLGRAVTTGDEEAIRQQLEQTGAFAMTAPVTPMPEGGGGLSPTLRLWLIVIGAVVLTVVLIRALSCAAR